MLEMHSKLSDFIQTQIPKSEPTTEPDSRHDAADSSFEPRVWRRSGIRGMSTNRKMMVGDKRVYEIRLQIEGNNPAKPEAYSTI